MPSLLVVFLLECCFFGWFGDGVSVEVSLTEPIAVTSPSFVGVNIDAASLYQGTRLDVADVRFRDFACKFGEVRDSPMTLRIGGSAADDLSTFLNSTRHGHIFLTRDYWDDIIDFVDACGFNLAWDLNMRIGRSTNSSDPWDPQDTLRLLDHVREKHQSVWALQLGNEPGHYQTRNGGLPTAKQHGADFVALDKILSKYYPPGSNLETKRPRMQGPDVCFGAGTQTQPCADMSYFRDVLSVLGPSMLTDITGHAYGLRGPKKGRVEPSQCTIEAFLNPELFQAQVIAPVSKWKAAMKELAPASNFILSETASAADGGCPNLSNRFVSGFYYMEILGALGDMGVFQVYRQNLVGYGGINFGSSYALLDPPGWFAGGDQLVPNPDYFTALLYRKLVGTARLKVDVPSDQYIHAACAVGGGVVLTYINPSPDALEVNITFTAGDMPSPCTNYGSETAGMVVEKYILTAPQGNLTSDQVELNGKVLSMSSALEPSNSFHETVVNVPPFSYGFLVSKASAK
jgi:heparanase|eukprot:g486.t1